MTEEQIRTDVADLLDLDPQVLDPDASLSGYGLDSLRLIMLAEKWRAEGVDVDFHTLLSHDTLTQWFQLYR